MSTLNVESISHPTPGSNVTINGITPAGTNQLGNRNLIINGAMQVAQRGTSTNVAGYLLDRFRMDASGGTRLVTQESLSSGDPYDEGFRYFHRLKNTGTATGASNYREIVQYIEAQNVAQSGWDYTSSDSYITLSAWVRASVAQTYYILFRTSDGTEQNYGTAFTLSANTWTKVTKTIPGNSNITINSDNGTGFAVYFYPFIGTDYTDSNYTTDTWAAHSGSAQLPDMTNTWAGTTNATFDLTGVQLEVGSVATPFEHRSYGDELERCKRYYYLLARHTGSSISVGAGQGWNANEVDIQVRFPVSMRTAPSLDMQGGANYFSIQGGGISSAWIDGTFNLQFANTEGCNIYSSPDTSVTTGNMYHIVMVGSGAFLAFSAEL